MEGLLVSVIVPCYNQVDYIVETLESILKQTYSNWECIIVDDGSKDDSKSIIEAFIKNKPQFYLIHQKNSGVAIARNNAIKKSKGAYILPLDGDDLIHKDYLKLCIKAFQENPDLRLVYGKAELFGLESGYWPLPPYEYERFIIVNCIFNSAMYKRIDYDKTQGYDDKLIHGYEDWDFLLQLISKKDKLIKLDSIVYYYRQHKQSRNSFRNDAHKRSTTLNYIYKKHKRHYRGAFFLKLPYELFVNQSYSYRQLDRIKRYPLRLIKYYFYKKIRMLF